MIALLMLILLMYLVLGCLMDAMAMVILTVPIVFPVVTALGLLEVGVEALGIGDQVHRAPVAPLMGEGAEGADRKTPVALAGIGWWTGPQIVFTVAPALAVTGCKVAPAGAERKTTSLPALATMAVGNIMARLKREPWN